MQQLERESEDLDQSFQAYLRRQQMLKQQMNDDASRIWANYSLSKAALAQIDANDNRNINIRVHQPNLVDNTKIDHILNSTFNDDVNIQDVLKDLNDIKRLKTPPFNKEDAFPTDNLMTFKPQRNSMDTIIEKSLHPIMEYEETVLATPIKTTFPKKYSSILLEKESKEESGTKRKNEVEKITENGKTQDQKDVKTKETMSLSLEVASSIPLFTQNGTSKTRVETQFPEQNAQVKVTEPLREEFPAKPSTSSNVNEKNIERMENGNKSPDHLKPPTALENGKTAQNGENSKSYENQMEMKTKFSPLILNGFSKPGPSLEIKEVELNTTDKEAKITNGKGIFKPIGRSFTNGFSSKSATFVARVSDSESNDAESEQISIGAQRLVKSPDDFWI